MLEYAENSDYYGLGSTPISSLPFSLYISHTHEAASTFVNQRPERRIHQNSLIFRSNYFINDSMVESTLLSDPIDLALWSSWLCAVVVVESYMDCGCPLIVYGLWLSSNRLLTVVVVESTMDCGQIESCRGRID